MIQPAHTSRFLLGLTFTFATFAMVDAAPAPKADKEEQKRLLLKLNDITGDDAITGQIATFLEKKNRSSTKKLIKVAREMTKDKKAKKQPLNINALYILARTAAGLSLYDDSAHFYYINTRQAARLLSIKKLIRSFSGRIDVLYVSGNFKEAEKACQEFMSLPLRGNEDLDYQKILVLEMLIRTQAKQGKIDQALKLVDTMIKGQSEKSSWIVRKLKGWVYREAEKYKEAVEVYEDVIARIQRDDRLKKPQQEEFINGIRYTLSGLYVDMKKLDKAGEILKTLMKAEPENATYPNDLGFIWADHDMNLDEAEKLIRKALELDKKERGKSPSFLPNAAYLDSLGWVLYKKKKYKEALKYLKEAVEQEEGRHAEIYDHLGDTYLALGQVKQALETWKKAAEQKPLSKRDEKRIKSVKEKIKKHSESNKGGVVSP